MNGKNDNDKKKQIAKVITIKKKDEMSVHFQIYYKYCSLAVCLLSVLLAIQNLCLNGNYIVVFNESYDCTVYTKPTK